MKPQEQFHWRADGVYVWQNDGRKICKCVLWEDAKTIAAEHNDLIPALFRARPCPHCGTFIRWGLDEAEPNPDYSE